MHCKHCKQEIRLGPEKHRCAEGDAAAKEKAEDRLDAAACSGFRLTLEAVGLTKAHAMAHAVRVLALMMEEAHNKGHCCGTINGNASAKLDVIA